MPSPHRDCSRRLGEGERGDFELFMIEHESQTVVPTLYMQLYSIIRYIETVHHSTAYERLVSIVCVHMYICNIHSVMYAVEGG